MAQSTLQSVNRGLPILIGVLLFAAIGALTEFLVQTQRQSETMSQDIDVQTNLFSIRDKVDRSLQSILHLSIGMTSYVEAKNGEIEAGEVSDLLKHLFEHAHSNHVRSFDLMRDTTIQYVYPEGHGEVIGLDLREVPAQWPDLLAAINSREGVLAGPVDLVQGGTAYIFRVPIRVHDEHWGIFNIMLDLESYLGEIAVYGNSRAGAFAIRDGQTILAGNAGTFDADHVQIADVAVLGGTWQIAVAPQVSLSESFTLLLRFLGWATALCLGAAITIILTQREALKGLVLIDELTGVANRRQFDLMLEKYCHKYNRRDSGQFALLYVDLDRFKEINDNHGHKAGDYFLIEVARKLKSATRGGDLVARWGGDEFAVIVDNPSESSV